MDSIFQKYCCVLVLLLSLYYPLQADGDCDKKLALAEEYFREGKLETFEDSLEESLVKCIPGFENNKQVDALRLLTIKALLKNDNQKADHYFSQLLEISPEFRLDLSQQTDPAELIYLYKSFRTRPLLSLDYQAGVGITGVNTAQRFAVDNSLSRPSYGYVPGLVLGGEAMLPFFNRNLGLVVGLNFNRKQFTYSDVLETLSTTNSTQPDFTLNFTERQDWLEVPIMLRYDFDKKSIYNFERNALVPMIEGGISYARLVNAKFIQPQRFNSVTASQLGQDINVRDLRQHFQANLLVGGGLKYKWNEHYFFVKVRYSLGLTNVVNDENRYSPKNQDLIYTYGYVDDNFTVNSLSVIVGFEQTIYSPHPKNRRR